MDSAQPVCNYCCAARYLLFKISSFSAFFGLPFLTACIHGYKHKNSCIRPDNPFWGAIGAEHDQYPSWRNCLMRRLPRRCGARPEAIWALEKLLSC